MSFVIVNREKFCKVLEDRGFSVDPDSQGELTYIMQHRFDPTMYIKIYTSLPLAGGDSRSCGADAIRVLLIFKNPRSGKSGCLYKASRVHRTGSEDAVIERTLERARECYKQANDRVKARLPR